MEINKDSICLRCAHLKTIIVEDYRSINRTIALVDCEEEVYAFPFQTNYPCSYFKKGETEYIDIETEHAYYNDEAFEED